MSALFFCLPGAEAEPDEPWRARRFRPISVNAFTQPAKIAASQLNIERMIPRRSLAREKVAETRRILALFAKEGGNVEHAGAILHLSKFAFPFAWRVNPSSSKTPHREVQVQREAGSWKLSPHREVQVQRCTTELDCTKRWSRG